MVRTVPGQAFFSIVLTTFGVAGVAQAQTASVDANFSVSARAMAAIEVPHAAIELRAAGVPEPEVRTALVAVHHHHIPAPEVHLMLTHSARHVHVHGPIPAFGHFVEVKLDDGFRGPRLYKSIRIEHGKRRGPPAHAGPPPHAGPKHRGRAEVNVHVHGPDIPRPPSPHVRIDVHGGGPAHHKLKVHGGGHKVKFKAGHKLKVHGGGHKVKVKAGHGRGKH